MTHPSGPEIAGARVAFADKKDIPAEEMCPGYFRRTLVWGRDLMLVSFDIKKDHPMPEHHHVHEQAGVVISGAIEMTIGSEKRLCTAGTSYFIPSGVPHSAFAVEDTVVLDTFSPPREEYKPAGPG